MKYNINLNNFFSIINGFLPFIKKKLFKFFFFTFYIIYIIYFICIFFIYKKFFKLFFINKKYTNKDFNFNIELQFSEFNKIKFLNLNKKYLYIYKYFLFKKFNFINIFFLKKFI